MSQPEQPSRHISLVAATAIVVASMVGTGVFTSLGFQIFTIPDGSGYPVMMLWVVGGIVALCGALCYAELTSMMPRSGGEYHLVGQAYHPLLGFLAGWVSITAGFSAPIALAAMAFGKYFQGVWNELAKQPWWGQTVPSVDKSTAAYALVIVLTLLQLGGVRFIAKFHVSLTIMRLLLIIAFIAGALWMGSHPMDWSVLKPKPGLTLNVGLTKDSKTVTTASTAGFVAGELVKGSGIPDGTTVEKVGADSFEISNAATATTASQALFLSDQQRLMSHWFAMSLFWVMFAYAGWNGAVYVAGEMHNAQRNLPLALLFGTVIVMALYIGLNAVFVAGGKWADMRGQPDVGLVAARGIFSGSGPLWMGGLIAFGLLSTVNAMLWTGATTLRVIGHDMRALCWLDASDRRGEPVSAVLFMTNLVLLLLGTGSFQALLDYIQALLQLSSLLCVAAVVWWRIRWPRRERPFKVPLFPLPPLIFIGVSIWMLYVMVQDKPKESLWGAATLILGVILYFCSPKAPATEPASESSP